MRLYIIGLFIFFTSFTSISQNSFKEGYYLDSNGIKQEGLIYDMDWQHSPDEITFKKNINSDKKIIRVQDLKEFEIYNRSKYINKEVLIDKSINSTNKFNRSFDPDFQNEKILLKILVTSNNTELYRYHKSDKDFFFFRNNSLEIQQLIFKEYKSDNKIKVNNTFRMQLYKDVNCNNTSKDDFISVSYYKKDLIEYFKDYIECKNHSYEVLMM
jgi:hypothetical protein